MDTKEPCEESILDYEQDLWRAFWLNRMWSFELGDCTVIYCGDDLIVCEGVENPNHCGYDRSGRRHATSINHRNEFPTLFWTKPIVKGGQQKTSSGA